jgi:hypothetical protein
VTLKRRQNNLVYVRIHVMLESRQINLVYVMILMIHVSLERRQNNLLCCSITIACITFYHLLFSRGRR